MRRAAIYSAVVLLMAASIALIGFVGPLVVSLVLEYAARRHRKRGVAANRWLMEDVRGKM